MISQAGPRELPLRHSGHHVVVVRQALFLIPVLIPAVMKSNRPRRVLPCCVCLLVALTYALTLVVGCVLAAPSEPCSQRNFEYKCGFRC